MKPLLALALVVCGFAHAQITPIQGTDTISASRVTINTNFSWLFTNKVETASNTGSTGVGLFKQKSSADLQFYKIASANNLITVALSGTDFVQLTLNPANFTNIVYSGTLTRTGIADGCANWISGALGTTGSACGSGGGGEANTTADVGGGLSLRGTTPKSGVALNLRTIAATAPLTVAQASDLVTFAMPAATGSVNGYLSASDFATFSNKYGLLASPSFASITYSGSLTRTSMSDGCAQWTSAVLGSTGAPCGSGGGGGNAFSSSVAVTYSATPTFTVPSASTTGAHFKTTLTGNVTSSTLASAVNGQMINFTICQDATGGRSFVWPSNVINGMTITSTRNSAPSTCYTQHFVVDSAGNAYGRREFNAGSTGGLSFDQNGDIDIVTSVMPRLGAANVWAALQTFDIGYQDIKRVSAPASPASGYLRVYADNADGLLKCKDSSGAACISSGSGGGSAGPVNGTNLGGLWPFGYPQGAVGVSLGNPSYQWGFVFSVEGSYSINKAVIHVAAAGSSNCSGGSNPCGLVIGIYNGSGTRIGITTPITTELNSTGEKVLSFTGDVALTDGTYYLGIRLESTDVALSATNSNGLGETMTGHNTLVASGYDPGATGSGSSVTLPSTLFVMSTVSGYNTPHVYLYK